jgi:hypothetical protein
VTEIGDITTEEGDPLTERVRSGDAPAIRPSVRGSGLELGRFGLLGAVGPGRLGDTNLLDVAADYRGMDEAEVREALHDRKSLAALARDKGKSVDGLKDALRDEIRKDADQAVEDGALTNEQAERLADKLGNPIDELVEGSTKQGFELDFGGDGSNLEFHLRIRPEGAMPVPEGLRNPSFERAIPPQPL